MDDSAEVYLQLFRPLGDRLHQGFPESFSAICAVDHQSARLIAGGDVDRAVRAFADAGCEFFCILLVEVDVERADQLASVAHAERLAAFHHRFELFVGIGIKERFAAQRLPASCQEGVLLFVISAGQFDDLEVHILFHCASNLTSTAFWACSLFSASSKISGWDSMTSSEISSPLCAGRQCSTIASPLAHFISSPSTQ